MAERQPEKTYTVTVVTKGSKPDRQFSSTSKAHDVADHVDKTCLESSDVKNTKDRSNPESKADDVADNFDEVKSDVSMHKHAKNTNESNPESNTIDIMPIHMVEHDGTKYDLSKLLPKNSQIVIDQAKVIEEELKLATLGTDLSSLGKFVHLACCGVVGHAELQIKTRKVLINVGDITETTYCTLKDFESTAKSALNTMKIAYGYLKNNMEAEALKLFYQIQKKSEEMHKISVSLSTKCKEESENVNHLGNETLQKKADTVADKEETDRLAKVSCTEKQYESQALEESKKEAVEKKEEAAVTSDSEKKVFEDKKKLTEETEKKLQCKRQNIQEDKEKLKTTYEADDGNITKKIEDSQLKFEKALLSNKKSYELTLAKLNVTLQEKVKSAEHVYEQKINQAEEEFQEVTRKNDRLHEQEIQEIKNGYDKKVSDAEAKYEFTTRAIEKEYRDAIQESDDKLGNKLTQAKQKLEAELEANERKYSAKVKACWTDGGKAKEYEQWSKENSEARTNNSNTESSARSENIKAHTWAQDTRERKLKEAFDDKQSKIAQAEIDRKTKNQEAFKNNEQLNNDAAKNKRKADATAKSNKEKEISDAKKEKEADELKAKEKKENDDKSSKEIKVNEDAANESKRNHLLQQYKEQLQQKDEDLETIEKQINEKYQKDMKTIDENFQYLTKKNAEIKSDIKTIREQEMKSIQKILQLTQGIQDKEDLSKGQEISILCLHEAETALHHIQAILREASSFWMDVGRHCGDITEGGLVQHMDIMKTSDNSARQRIWKGNDFKEAALEYRGQWQALKDVCAKTSKNITSVKEEIRQYISNTPTKEEALTLVQKLGKQLLDSKAFEKISDKPANS